MKNHTISPSSTKPHFPRQQNKGSIVSHLFLSLDAISKR